VPTPSAVSAHRRELQTLTGLAGRDLDKFWRQFTTADMARDGLLDVLPLLVDLYGSAAATLGADWYDELREQAEVRGSFRSIPAELPDRGRTDALARWGIAPLFAAEPDFTSALSLVTGGLQRIVANADRQSVTASAVADPRARGWERRTTGGCDFCRMLAGRGAVYSEATADFESHDNCHCLAVPRWT